MSDYYNIKQIDKEKWLDYVSSSENSARHFAQLLSDGTFEGGYMSFRNDNVIKYAPYLKKGINVNETMLKSLRNYFIETGYFPERNKKMGE